MKLLIDVNHPAHVHVFRNAALCWLERGDEVYFTAADKDVTLRLLQAYHLPHEVVSVRRPGKLNLALELLNRTRRLIQVGRRFKPDVILSVGSPTAAFASQFLRVPHITFDDTEDSVGQAWLYRPFTKIICVPDCFGQNFGKKMIRYAGYHELTYLHPNRFTPDASKIAPLQPDEKFFVVRFIHFDAAHDVGEHGLSQAGREKLLNLLLAHGRVVLSLEKNPPVLLSPPPQPLPHEGFRSGDEGGTPDSRPFSGRHRSLWSLVPAPTVLPSTHEGRGAKEILDADAMHHFLAFATMYVGEGVTAASEAAVLGTPSILINTRKMGYILEQQDKYGLGYLFEDEQAALEKIDSMLRQDDLKQVWQCRREVLLRDKIDVTAWMVELVDNERKA